MTTAKQLAKYLSNNSVTENETEQRLNDYRKQNFCEGSESMYKFLMTVRRKRKSLQKERLKKEWDDLLSNLRDTANKKK